MSGTETAGVVFSRRSAAIIGKRTAYVYERRRFKVKLITANAKMSSIDKSIP